MRPNTMLLLAIGVAIALTARTVEAQYGPQYVPQYYQQYPAGYAAYPMPAQMQAAYPQAQFAAPTGAPDIVQATALEAGCDCDGECDGSCDAGIACDGCDGGCDSCGCVMGCVCGWDHRIAFFGEALYMRCRDSEVSYAVEMNGPGVAPPAVPIQVSRIGVVNQYYEPAFRAGFDIILDCDAAIRATYTQFESNRSDQITRQTLGNVIRSMVRHPSTITAGSDDITARAEHDIQFDLIDLEYRSLFICNDETQVVFLAGARYCTMEQAFDSVYTFNGQGMVNSDLDFDGVGARLGIDAERYLGSGQIKAYAKGAVSFVAGDIRGQYGQTSNAGAVEVATTWESSRIVSIWDLELGLGWRSPSDTWHASLGYVFSVWDNMVKTDEFINAVQTNNFLNLGDSMTFDGVVGRLEYRF